MKTSVIICTLLLFAGVAFSQKEGNYKATKKGQFFILWGWNRAAYSKSNIRFKGNDYDFTLYKVVAYDRPTDFNINDYFRIDRLTIPQNYCKIGYFIKDGLAVSFGFDHMKYVMKNDQTVHMKGVITRLGGYEGVYDGDKKLEENFLTFEHTNGLNYINVEVEKYKNVYSSNSGNFVADVMFGGGGGVLMPRSDIKLMSYGERDKYHLAGFGFSLKAGIQGTIFKHLTVKFESKNGFIDLPDIPLHKGFAGRAKQSFFFAQVNGLIGYNFKFNKKSK